MKTLIIDLVCENNHEKQAFYEDFDKNETHIVFQKDGYLNDSAFKEVDLIPFNELYTNAYDEAFKRIIDLGEYLLANGNSITEALKLGDEKSLWYYFRFMLLYKLRKRIFLDSILQKANFLKQKYEKIHIIHNSSFLNNLIKPNSSINSKYTFSKSSKHLSNILNFILITTSRFCIGLVRLIAYNFRPIKHIFLSNASAEQSVIELKSLKERQGDHFSEYFQNAIEHESDFVNISEFFPPKLTASNKVKFRWRYLTSNFKKTIPLETIIYLQLLNPRFYKRAIDEIKKVRSAFHLIEKESEVYLSNYHILKEFKSYKRLSYFIAIRKASLVWFFKKYNFKSITSTNEHDSRIKSIFEIASKYDIQTFGIQHGVIHFRHLHYYFSNFDAQFHSFPDYTFLWGDYWRNSLESFSAYPLKSLLIAGQLRTDVIPKLKLIEKTSLFPLLDSEKMTILYPSQPLYEGEEGMREKLALDFLQLTIDYPNVQFIIKPHPNEHDCHFYFKKLSKRLGTSNYTILNEDLYKMLAYSDLVIVYNSTVGAEAVYFKKPLIVMHYAENDFSGFVKAKIAYEVKSYNELSKAIQMFLDKKQLVEDEFQNKFITERAYKIDGLVAERMIDQIKLKTAG